MKVKYLGIIAAVLLTVSPVVTSTTRINTVQAATHHRRHRKDSQKYKVHAIHNIDLYPDTQSINNIKPKRLIKNFKSFPKGTKVRWAYGHKPKLSDRGLTDSIACFPVVVFPDHSKDLEETDIHLYGPSHIKVPTGYTLQAVTKADNDNRLSPTLKKINSKDYEYYPESKKEQHEKVDFNNLTPAQQQVLSKFAVRLLNQVRTQLGTDQVSTNSNIQEIANKISTKYKKDHWNYEWAHDYNAINPLLQSGGTEDLAGGRGKPKTMSDMKSLIYDGLVSMLFSTAEMHHAGDLIEDNPDLPTTHLALSYNHSDSFGGQLYYVHFILTK